MVVVVLIIIVIVIVVVVVVVVLVVEIILNFFLPSIKINYFISFFQIHIGSAEHLTKRGIR